jgi:hypothetical protein
LYSERSHVWNTVAASPHGFPILCLRTRLAIMVRSRSMAALKRVNRSLERRIFTKVTQHSLPPATTRRAARVQHHWLSVSTSEPPVLQHVVRPGPLHTLVRGTAAIFTMKCEITYANSRPLQFYRDSNPNSFTYTPIHRVRARACDHIPCQRVESQPIECGARPLL